MGLLKFIVSIIVLAVIAYYTYQSTFNRIDIETLIIAEKSGGIAAVIPDGKIIKEESADSLFAMLGYVKSDSFVVQAGKGTGDSIVGTIVILFGSIVVSWSIFSIIDYLFSIAPLRLQWRSKFFRWTHRWLGKYGLSRTDSTDSELRENYYELLRLLSSGFASEYENVNIRLSYNGTVSDLQERCEASLNVDKLTLPVGKGKLVELLEYWEKLVVANKAIVSRVFVSPPWIYLYNSVKDKNSLSWYSSVNKNIKTCWTHTGKENVEREIKNLKPDLDFALFEGDRNVGGMKERGRICVGYIKGSLVYTFQTNDECLLDKRPTYLNTLWATGQDHNATIAEINSHSKLSWRIRSKIMSYCSNFSKNIFSFKKQFPISSTTVPK